MTYMKNVVLLDLDGVLITTPSWRGDYIAEDGYSDFRPTTVKNLNKLFEGLSAELWLISARRKKKTLEEFRQIFKNRNITIELENFVPSYDEKDSRLDELNKFLKQETIDNFLIIDDDTSLANMAEDLKRFWVQTHTYIGFTEEKLNEAINIINNWKK